MKRNLLALAAAFATALAPLASHAQFANRQVVDAVSAVAECLAPGLPQQWNYLSVIIELHEPLADTGQVRYQVTLNDRTVPLTPCDPRIAPEKLIALRETQPEKERNWTVLILTMKPDASFDLKYEYDKRKF